MNTPTPHRIPPTHATTPPPIEGHPAAAGPTAAAPDSMGRRPDPDSPRAPERGAVTLEFVLMLPVFLTVVALVLGAGLFGTLRSVIDHGARAGARAASIPSMQGTYPDDAAVTAAVDEATPVITPSSVTVTGAAERNAPVEVEVTYTLDNPFRILFVPLEAFGLENPVSPDVTFTSRAEVRRE